MEKQGANKKEAQFFSFCAQLTEGNESQRIMMHHHRNSQMKNSNDWTSITQMPVSSPHRLGGMKSPERLLTQTSSPTATPTKPQPKKKSKLSFFKGFKFSCCAASHHVSKDVPNNIFGLQEIDPAVQFTASKAEATPSALETFPQMTTETREFQGGLLDVVQEMDQNDEDLSMSSKAHRNNSSGFAPSVESGSGQNAGSAHNGGSTRHQEPEACSFDLSEERKVIDGMLE